MNIQKFRGYVCTYGACRDGGFVREETAINKGFTGMLEMNGRVLLTLMGSPRELILPPGKFKCLELNLRYDHKMKCKNL
jgi:hypothetical protein